MQAIIRTSKVRVDAPRFPRLWCVKTHFLKPWRIIFALSMMYINAINAQESICAVRRITMESIRAKEKSIASMMYRHSLLRAVIASGVFVTSIVSSYAWCIKEKKSFLVPAKDALFVANPEDTRSFFERWSDAFVSGVRSACTYHNVSSLFHSVCYVAARYVVSSHIVKYAYHPYTLAWYIKNHARYVKIGVCIQEYSSLASSGQMETKEMDFYICSTHNLVQEMVDCVERICGYIAYQAVEESREKQVHYMTIVEYLMNRVNDWAEKIVIHVHNAQDEAVCIEETQALVRIIDREIKHVNVIWSEEEALF